MQHFEIIAKETRINEYQNLFEVKIDADLYMISIKSGYGKSTEIEVYIWNVDCWLPVDPKPYQLKKLARDIEFLFGKRYRRVVEDKKYSQKSRRKHLDQLKDFQKKHPM